MQNKERRFLIARQQEPIAPRVVSFIYNEQILCLRVTIYDKFIRNPWNYSLWSTNDGRESLNDIFKEYLNKK
jgi:hypothetical protein